MAKFPVHASATSYASDSDSKFIPAIWSTKLVVNFYDATVFGDIANTDYEGEITQMGDTVIIRTVPAVTIRNYVKGADLTYENLESDNVDLDIDKGKYWAFNAFKVDVVQSDLNLMNTWSMAASEDMAVKIDTDILAGVVSDAHASNAGATAGRKSGNINLGTTASPLALTKANILDSIVDYGTILDEQSAPKMDRWVILPPKACGLIKKSDLKDASITGDGTSILRNGRLGMIDRFTVYDSNNLSVASSKTSVLFGQKTAITFASQVVETQTLPNPDDFGDLVRGLQVFGYETIKSEALGVSVVTIA